MAGPKILSLFSGVGGLEIAVKLALPGSSVVGYVERDSFACSALMARMEESSMDLASVFVGEIQDVDGRELRGHVDVVCGGIPCQPYSLAGKLYGDEDDRALWREFARIVEECQPSLVFIENVPAFVTRGGFRPLGEELCRLGFDVADPLFIGAGDVGAPHSRNRVFILAHRDQELADGEMGGRRKLRRASRPNRQPDRGDEGLGDANEFNSDRGRSTGQQREAGSSAGCERLADATDDHRGSREPGAKAGAWAGEERRRRPPSGGEPMAGAERIRGGGGEQERGAQGRETPRRSGEELDDAERERLQGEQQRGATPGAVERTNGGEGRAVGEGGIPDAVGAEVRVEPERGGGAAREAECRDTITGQLGFFPPGPDDEPEWMRIIGGYPGLAPAIEPGFRVVADGLPMVLDESRADQLRCAGNSVVVLQALVAFRQLLRWTEES